jgi:hypothetical protein
MVGLGSCFPTLSAGKSGKDGARRVVRIEAWCDATSGAEARRFSVVLFRGLKASAPSVNSSPRRFVLSQVSTRPGAPMVVRICAL